jgi:hypothetical protein
MDLIKIAINAHRRVISAKRRKFFIFSLSMLALIAVYSRMQSVDSNFSYDYSSYILMVGKIGELSFSEILGDQLLFPYIITGAFVPVEFGFGLLVKVISLTGASPATTLSILAALSVGLRVQVMQSLGIPLIFVLLINLYAITLFEANALRLGIASSILLFGLREIYFSRNVSGFMSLLVSTAIHLQVIFFAVPFAIIYIFFQFIKTSKIILAFAIVLICVSTFGLIEFLPLLSNEKIQIYVSQGSSGSAGLTVTSAAAVILFTSVVMSLRSKVFQSADANFFAIVIASSLPSLFLLLFLTNIAVIGDRAWQLAFIVFSSFFFLNWNNGKSKIIPLLFFNGLLLLCLLNVMIVNKLSNFFSPPFPFFNP